VARDEFGCVSDSLDFEVIDQMISSVDTMYVKLCQGEFVQVGSDPLPSFSARYAFFIFSSAKPTKISLLSESPGYF
jgi:hypothetical protein